MEMDKKDDDIMQSQSGENTFQKEDDEAIPFDPSNSAAKMSRVMKEPVVQRRKQYNNLLSD